MIGTSFEQYNSALEAFDRADLSEALARLRRALFENLFVAPLLLDEEFQPLELWRESADQEPGAAREYVSRYGRLWRERPEALAFLAQVWADPLVRAELRSFVNLLKAMLGASAGELIDRRRERELFLSRERIARTQGEIIARIKRAKLPLPLPAPSLGLILLASRDPAASIEFYRRLLGVEPVKTGNVAGGYVEFRFAGVVFAIHGQSAEAPGDPYLLGPAPASLGWGAIFVFRVSPLNRYLKNAQAIGATIVDQDLGAGDKRFFVVKDPSGYLLELTEAAPKGLDSD